MKRLVVAFLSRSCRPLDTLEENLLISAFADYMGYLFLCGYQDFDSNCRKLNEELAAAVSNHLAAMRLKREKEWERRFVAVTEVGTAKAKSPN